MLRSVVELAAYGFAATLAAICLFAGAWKWGGWSWAAVSRQLRRSALAVMVAMAVVATMKAQKGDRGTGTTGDPPAPVQQTGTTGVSPVEDITDTFHFSAIAVFTNGTVTLTTAWTNGLLTAGQTIDILVKTDLRDATWTWLTNGVVEAGATNMSWTIENQSPSNSFYKAVVRDTLTDMDDPDGDGLPNVYELAHGRNPWVHDYALVQKLTVGPNGEFGDIASALADSPAALLGIGAFAPIPSDSLDDTDHDTLLDYNEVYDRGMDPFLADTDGDGIPDDVEILVDHTDPTDPHSFKQNLTVTVTNKDSTASAVYTAWDTSEAGWAPNGLAAFPEGFGTTNYIDASSQGATHVKAFCDLNGNGTFDAEYDILRVRSIPLGSTAQVNFVFGDVDGDGVPDLQERQQGTDPYDGNSFRLVATVNVVSSDVVPGLTNYVAWSYSAAGWEPNDLARFSGSSLPYQINVPVMGGELFVKVFRDFNTNGIYDVGVDALVSNQLTWAHNGKTVTFNIGDSDGDKIVDSVELAEGTNPLDKLSYCFNLSLTYTGVFQTTNALTFAASFGTNRVYGPCVVEGNIWTNDFGHRATTTGEQVSVNVWDDANKNGDWDVGETSNKYVIAVTGHDMFVRNTLSYLNFDRNYNEIPDWWEVQEGLDAEGVACGTNDDPDGDGLINLHEFWCGKHPLVPDGWDTLFSVASRSIDDRIEGKNPTNSLCLFENYFANGTNCVFQVNPNFWAADVDFSGICVWNSSDQHNERAGALISPQHLLFANHWPPSSTNEILYFRGKSGSIYSRTPVRWQRIYVPSEISTYPDTSVVLLNEPLDTNDVSVMSIFSTNLLVKVGNGYAVPFIYFNRKKEALVKEITSLTSGGENPMWHHISFMKPRIAVRQSFVTDVPGIPGDSSSPSFILLGNRLIVLGVHSRTGSDSPIFLFAHQIQQAMDALAPGWELQIEDVSSFQGVQ